ncbi:MAG: hypothetical protein JWO00_199 [Candidatus Parcubacteria bacterium]|nr:hypothetical protein [Candidatus Parcubacteria bacterium]
MNAKSFIWIGVFVGSSIGAYIPALWGAGVFSFSSILLSAVGGFAGIWAGFRLGQML